MTDRDFWNNWLQKRGYSPKPRSRHRLPDLAATVGLARKLSEKLKPGDILALAGDLGVGKTAFTAALADALGLPDEVASPTFILVMEHESDTAELSLYHFDVYRLEDEEDFLASGLDEYFERGGVCVIEWPERIASILPKNTTLIRLMKPDSDSDERIAEIHTEEDLDL